MEKTAGEAVYKAVEQNARKAPGFAPEEWAMWHELPLSEKRGWEIIAHTAIGWYKDFHGETEEPNGVPSNAR